MIQGVEVITLNIILTWNIMQLNVYFWQINDDNEKMVVEFFLFDVNDLNIPKSFGIVTFGNATALPFDMHYICISNPCENSTCRNT